MTPQEAAVMRDFLAQQAEMGQYLTPDQALSDPLYQSIILALQSEEGGRVLPDGSKVFAPDSPKALALVALGRRPYEADWWVGETP